VNALVADGWVVTHDPLSLSYGGRDLYVDLGVEDVTVGAAPRLPDRRRDQVLPERLRAR